MLVVSFKESPMRLKYARAFEAVPKMVKTTKRLKKVKKKFLDISDISTSPCDIIPCSVDSPACRQLRFADAGRMGSYSSKDTVQPHSTAR